MQIVLFELNGILLDNKIKRYSEFKRDIISIPEAKIRLFFSDPTFIAIF